MAKRIYCSMAVLCMTLASSQHRDPGHTNLLVGCAIVMLPLTLFVTVPNASGSSLTLKENSRQDQQSKIAVPLPKGKKLMLSDGTFQVGREYRREGDRVRYYSVERSAWEEVPATLVDWDATEKA